MTGNSKIKWLAIIIAFALVAATHCYYEYGSDGDEALEMGIAALLRGESPYDLLTQLNQALTPLPGWMILNAPSMIIGAHLVNFIWIALFAMRANALSVILLLLVSGKTLISGVDYASNGCAVLCACAMFKTYFSTSSTSTATAKQVGSRNLDGVCADDVCCEADGLGKPHSEPAVCDASGNNNANVFLIVGCLLLLPAICVSRAAEHVIMAVPFLLLAYQGHIRRERDDVGRKKS